MEPSRLLTPSLRSNPWGESVARILAAALREAEPGAAVTKYLKIQPVDNALGKHSILSIGNREYPLDEIRQIYIVGAGKAGAPMTEAAVKILGDRVNRGVAIVKEGYAGGVPKIGNISIREAGHPVPDERGLRAAREVFELLQDSQSEDLVLCLISGGGSALLVSPVESVSLNDLQLMTEILLGSGASINEINTLRKHLEKLKGGQLARLASPAQVATLILSDVVGDPLEVIASGPTLPDPTTYRDSLAILDRYGIMERVPGEISSHLIRGQSGEFPETPKADDPVFDSVHNFVIGSNLQAAEAALKQAEFEGFNTLLLSTYLQGEAREAGRALGAIARQIAADGRPLPRPACLVVGGETTVTIKGKGKGGRNQELALGAVHDLAGLTQVVLLTLATDGGDGPTDAAGAVATGETLERARQAGLDPVDFLAHNDAYNFFEPLGDLLKPGPTKTNVNDLAFIFAF
jgi:hydroxypyruvate reductase